MAAGVDKSPAIGRPKGPYPAWATGSRQASPEPSPTVLSAPAPASETCDGLPDITSHPCHSPILACSRPVVLSASPTPKPPLRGVGRLRPGVLPADAQCRPPLPPVDPSVLGRSANGRTAVAWEKGRSGDGVRGMSGECSRAKACCRSKSSSRSTVSSGVAALKTWPLDAWVAASTVATARESRAPPSSWGTPRPWPGPTGSDAAATEPPSPATSPASATVLAAPAIPWRTPDRGAGRSAASWSMFSSAGLAK
mmetsp:Transcript_20388/g.51732  ORF Transcript_20388/g.51732 Transcript_20388/m.51732 type:complete len:253 (-) Transcript_20388:43-801(-)